MVFAERPTDILQQLRQRVLVDSGQAADSPERNALGHHSEDLSALGGRELINKFRYAL